MKNFRYTARDRAGQTRDGVMQAEDRQALLLSLRREGLLPVSIREDNGIRWHLPSLNPFDYRPIHSADVEQAFHQLAVLQKSGVTLLDAVKLIGEFSRPPVRRVWESIGTRIRGGSSLAEALAEHAVFGNLVVQLVNVGEHTGHLDIVLDQASKELEERRRLRNQLISALIYPGFVLLFTIGVAAFLLIKIIPEIRKFLSLMGRKMPPITQALIDTADWIQANLLVLGVGTAASICAFLVVYRWPPARLFFDTLALRVPIMGRIFRLSGTVVFSRTLGLMLKSGVRIVDALEIVEQVHYNRYLAGCVARVRRRVIEGSSLAGPLESRYGYMPLLARMVVVGENSGALDRMLEEMAAFHGELLQKAIQRLAGLVAPAMTVIVGGMIGFVYAAFLVAMFSAAGGSPK